MDRVTDLKRTQRIDFLHISKAGGVAIKSMVRRNRKLFGGRTFILHGHEVTFPDVVRANDGAAVFFVVRDPVDRYVSGFNSRLRKALPRALAEWDEGERTAFGRFTTPNQLAEALSSANAATRDAAGHAMNSIWHAKYHLSYWLDSVAFLEKHRHHIWYIGEQRHLGEDIERIKSLLELPAEVELPTDDIDTHRTPSGFSTELSPEGRRNIENWYRYDYPVYRWCESARKELIAKYEGQA